MHEFFALLLAVNFRLFFFDSDGFFEAKVYVSVFGDHGYTKVGIAVGSMLEDGRNCVRHGWSCQCIALCIFGTSKNTQLSCRGFHWIRGILGYCIGQALASVEELIRGCGCWSRLVREVSIYRKCV